MATYFLYGQKEIDYLKMADKQLAEVIDRVGFIKREVNPDLFSALVHTIIGQQISTKAHQTIWERMMADVGNITPEAIGTCTVEKIQKYGLSFRKAGYIHSTAQKILSGNFDIDALHHLSDADVCAELIKLNGVGVWTAEMLMLFSMQRPNILSFGDLAIQRGLRMVYQHERIDKEIFNSYFKRYSPFASVASLYLWAVAGGAIEELKDDAHPKNKK